MATLRAPFLAVAAVALLFVLGVALAGSSDPNNNDGVLFKRLYKSVEAMVIPAYDPSAGSPTQVILFEMPGLVINRNEYDSLYWSASGFQSRQPDAVAAQFVDRLPYYTGPIFADSGSRISTLWGFFMYQYIIPIVDDPVQVAKVNDARAALSNGTLQATYSTASAAYEASFNDYVNFRSNCLAKQDGGVCASQGVIYRERLKRKWFSLEVARRDVAAAESKIIALQVQDLKNLFAEQLYTYASNERVDMGAAGFGQSFYQTYLTPSNFWRWWPTTGIYDYYVRADGSTVTLGVPSGATVTTQPLYGTFTVQASGNYTYLPNAGYTGSDRYTYTYNSTLPSGVTVQLTTTKSIQVIGDDVLAADTAFVSVAASSTASSSETKSFSSTFDASVEAAGSYGLFQASGSASASNSKSRESMTASGSSASMAFDLARVAITRPWLDTAILSFYPVAIRNLATNGWSDGTITPAPGPLAFRFKLLPVAFLVARNINLQIKLTQSMTDLQTSAEKYGGSVKASYGPFFSGSASASYGSNSRDYRESSSTSSQSISIRGPQVIGWVCTPIPPFPTSDEAGVRAWEAQQIARQNVATSLANSTLAQSSSSAAASSTNKTG